VKKVVYTEARRALVFTLMFGFGALAGGTGAFGADPAGSYSFGGEIARTKRALSAPGVTDRERHDAYALLGRLLKLSGDVEGAAAAWMNAAYAEPRKRDDTALLESAACYISMGEWDKAEANVNIVLLTVRDDKALFQKARYLSARIENFRDGNGQTLKELTVDPDYAAVQPSIYLTLWRITNNGDYKARLLTEFPESPEAKILIAETRGGGKNGINVTEIPPNALFLSPARPVVNSVNISAAEARMKPVSTLPPEESFTGAPVPESGPYTTESGPDPAETGPYTAKTGMNAAAAGPEMLYDEEISPSLQVGVFSGIDNAILEAGALRDMGFRPEIIRKGATGKNSDSWALMVPAGDDMNQTINGLRDAGYDPFPVY